MLGVFFSVPLMPSAELPTGQLERLEHRHTPAIPGRSSVDRAATRVHVHVGHVPVIVDEEEYSNRVSVPINAGSLRDHPGAGWAVGSTVRANEGQPHAHDKPSTDTTATWAFSSSRPSNGRESKTSRMWRSSGKRLRGNVGMAGTLRRDYKQQPRKPVHC
jgi:hypothetical protein